MSLFCQRPNPLCHFAAQVYKQPFRLFGHYRARRFSLTPKPLPHLQPVNVQPASITPRPHPRTAMVWG